MKNKFEVAMQHLHKNFDLLEVIIEDDSLLRAQYLELTEIDTRLGEIFKQYDEKRKSAGSNS